MRISKVVLQLVNPGLLNCEGEGKREKERERGDRGKESWINCWRE